MKSTLLLGATAALLLTSMASASAQVITSIQFFGYNQALHGLNQQNNPANDTAGEGPYSVNNWNSIFTTPGGTAGTASGGITSPLFDSTGTATDLAFSTAYTRGDGTGNTANNFTGDTAAFYTTSGIYNKDLVGYGITGASNTLSLSIVGLTVGDTYDVVAYVSALYYGGSPDSVTDGTQTFYYNATNSTGLTGFVQGTSTTAAGAMAANYVDFSGVTSDDGTLSLVLSGNVPALEGFQIVDTTGVVSAAVPEPSTVWMMSLGFLGLMAHLYRKRFARS